ncbi:RNA polymerase sigma-70 factor, ECF subfamily [Chitinophaga costaii]|uniref:RNA polymerase sigma-70 factor, ECF subfamily n=1 Tax=Chitinophaga costaii TaxID=1335309 RepID=A0A1C4FVA3_9BACT|nr:sigma-70 family RNA polymerase sigma factor [Chitinophaga costaii]PUZ27214.1 hypothetical protein DCM91_08335 [Chitinophaga costaii]SCC59451.1 RNA polymerase sigma-70 factor, ECF subfamily [Chitinophaga costaii]
MDHNRDFLEQQSDHFLLHLVKHDNERAFIVIYDRYKEIIFNAVFSILKEKSAALDVLQDIFCWLWEHRKDIEIDSLKHYLLAAGRFKALNNIKKTKAYIDYALLQENTWENLNTSYESPEKVLLNKELLAFMNDAINVLPPKCRRIFLLRRMYGFSVKQIADELQLSIKTVENQVTVALRRLRETFGAFKIFF